jgi:hypothetical protein
LWSTQHDALVPQPVGLPVVVWPPLSLMVYTKPAILPVPVAVMV